MPKSQVDQTCRVINDQPNGHPTRGFKTVTPEGNRGGLRPGSWRAHFRPPPIVLPEARSEQLPLAQKPTTIKWIFATTHFVSQALA